MTVVPLDRMPEADAPATPAPLASSPAAGPDFARALGDALGGASDALRVADGAERAFVSGRGGLQEMVLERAQADVALSLASAAASRVTGALNTILGMQL